MRIGYLKLTGLVRSAKSVRPVRNDRPPSGEPRFGVWLLLAWFGLLPTPWLANSAETSGGSSGLSSLALEPRGGVYRSNVVLNLVGRGNPSAVVFTLTGESPTGASPRWTESLTLTNSAWVRWRIVDANGRLGPVQSDHYVLLDSDLDDFTSNLPLAIIDTQGRELSRDRKDIVPIRLMDHQPGRTSLSGVSNYEGLGLINIRGRASLRYPKRSFTLKCIDEEGDDRAVSLLGLPKDEDYVLYAPYPDKTLMRDVLAYELGAGTGRWAPRTRFLEVFLTDGKGKLSREDYVGVYVLEERIKRHASRMDIRKLSPADADEPAVTGGYIFKKDHIDRGYYGPPDLLGGGIYQSSSTNKSGFPTPPGGFPADPKGFLPTYKSSSRSRESSNESSSSTSSRRIPPPAPFTNLLTAPVLRARNQTQVSTVYYDDDEEIVERIETGFVTSLRTNQFYWVEPEEDEVSPVQRDWLRRYLNRFEATLYGEHFRDPARGYHSFLEATSFIDYHLIVEVTKNVDGHRFSTFYTKDRGGKLRLEPMWDWNLSFGNCNGKQGWLPEHWFWPQLNETEYTWFRRLFEDPDFGQRYVDRWGELRESLFATERLRKRIEELAALLNEAQARNFARWPILGQGVNPNFFVGDTYREEVDWMKDWLTKRLAWMDEQFVKRPRLESPAAPAGGPRVLRGQVARGELVYRLDGKDPRAEGGGISDGARTGSGEVQISLQVQEEFFGRVRFEDRWSPPTRIKP